ncbi:MAG: hypothetical protein ACXWUK_01180 [Burkholderiales bacterium]
MAAELQPIEHEVGAAQRRLAQQLHALLAGTNGERPNRKHRARVRSLLLHVVDNLLQDGPDAELEALYNRYGDISYAERRRQDVDIAEVLFGQMLGPDVMRGHEARNVDELARPRGRE